MASIRSFIIEAFSKTKTVDSLIKSNQLNLTLFKQSSITSPETMAASIVAVAARFPP